jgi:hypothetical protein
VEVLASDEGDPQEICASVEQTPDWCTVQALTESVLLSNDRLTVHNLDDIPQGLKCLRENPITAPTCEPATSQRDANLPFFVFETVF